MAKKKKVRIKPGDFVRLGREYAGGDTRDLGGPAMIVASTGNDRCKSTAKEDVIDTDFVEVYYRDARGVVHSAMVPECVLVVV